ncbi:hypothetical protein MSAN_01032900 [Mycena sanguinolenta]|uniref:Tyrosine-protein kinase ephrin type A/B receptor-like domain-containing protein n=1 Tax=Mycena sanguinolenta TaxID=230812 RepID=A0A8H6YRZ9_9AGAR|nr:hypothetical protein MSAN_01032800 [Mycena sanguinolenta]KAF7363751.1 hypothetical protein MSAN_01032900 [Mycena sanguinolenta]
MLFASSIVTSALILSGVSALPQFEDGLVGRASTCDPGSYSNGTACALCPAGNTCDGNSNPQPCGTGYYQPSQNSTTCLVTDRGHFTNQTGSAVQIPCPPGTFQPHCREAFCYGASSGLFQQKYGQAVACETCPGWATNMTNNNVNPVNCTGDYPDSPEGSGNGCFKAQPGANMTHSLTCAQSANGQCPGKNFTDTAGNCPAPPTNSSGAN